jgi:hypothetical protein
MLIGIALDPTCFGSEELSTPEGRAGAERILEAVSQNAVLVTRATDPFVDELVNRVLQLDVRIGQEIQLATAEIAKNRVRFIAMPKRQDRYSGETRIDELRRIAVDMRADIVVCRDGADLAAIAELTCNDIEVCTVAQYRSSRSEARRRRWLAGQRLDRLAPADSAELLGRATMYAEEILILDKMFARAGKDGHVTEQLRRFARGVVHIVEQWRIYSPFASEVSLSVVLVSAAGNSGAAAGFVDPEKAETAIRAALADADRRQVLTQVAIDLRRDSSPAMFKDRFLAGFGRCWSISHGLDDIGRLGDLKAKRGPTILAPDCQAYRDTLADIKLLPKA